MAVEDRGASVPRGRRRAVGHRRGRGPADRRAAARRARRPQRRVRRAVPLRRRVRVRLQPEPDRAGAGRAPRHGGRDDRGGRRRPTRPLARRVLPFAAVPGARPRTSGRADRRPAGRLAVAVGAGTRGRPDLRRAGVRAGRRRLLAASRLRRAHPRGRCLHHSGGGAAPGRRPVRGAGPVPPRPGRARLGARPAADARSVVARARLLRLGRAVRTGVDARPTPEPPPSSWTR